LLGGGKPPGELSPGRAAVSRFVQAAPRTLPGAVFPRPLSRGPQGGIDRPGIAGIERQGDGPGVLVLVKHFLPGLAAIARAEHAALGVGSIGMPQNGDEHAVGIAWIDEDRGNLLAVF
jgi:hypothetical protein